MPVALVTGAQHGVGRELVRQLGGIVSLAKLPYEGPTGGFFPNARAIAC